MIPAEQWHDNDDGTAWVVGTEWWATTIMRDAQDRQCDEPACNGGWWYDKDDDPQCKCEECQGTARHVFEVEVEVTKSHVGSKHDRHDLCDHCFGFARHRVHVVSGMVLPIVHHLDWVSGVRCIEFDKNGEHVVWDDDGVNVTLPPAAAPGMWAVKLAVV